MKQVLSFLLFSSFLGLLAFTQKKETNTIQWLSIAELNTLYIKNPKPILIDIYTDWCGWCKEMDKKTYSNKKLAAYVNQKYYAVKFNAEDKAELTFNNKKYKYNKNYKTHELALYLTGGQLSYPTTVFLADANAQPAPIPGFMKPKEIEAPLKYFGELADKKESYISFSKKLKTEW